jgi:hypothetical protein
MCSRFFLKYSRCCIFFLSLFVFFLWGCSPELDWRKVVVTNQPYSATFPARPVLMQRQFQIAEETVVINMQAVQTQGAYFAVGVIDLSPKQQAKALAISQALQQAMQNNIQSTQARSQAVMVKGVQWIELQALGQWPAQQSALQKNIPWFIQAVDSSAKLVMRVLVLPGKIIEVLAVGQTTVLSDDVLDQWFSGFELML